MKKSLIIIGFFFITFFCYICSRNINYVEHDVYIYRFIDSTHIKVINNYNYITTVEIDTNMFNYCKQNKKNIYKLKSYDDGRKFLNKK